MGGYGPARYAGTKRNVFTLGVAGPVGSGKTALVEALCRALWPEINLAVITNDIYTHEDAEFLSRREVLPLERIVGVFARLQPPIDFEAPDEEPVDLVFLLLAPEHAGADHLKALARVSRLVRAPHVSERLRAAHDGAAIYAILTEPAAVEAV